jgi:Tfp pilus assembly protein PilO
MEAAVKIKNRQEFLMVLTVAAFALLVGVNFILEPLGGWWSARQMQIKDLRTKVADGNRLLKREAGIRSRWADMTANALPANTSLAEQKLLTAVDGWSRGSGAEVTSLMPQWKNEATNYLTLTCRVETSGDLGALSRFLYDLERGPMALRLDSLELGAHDQDGQQMTLSVEINGLALVQPDKK